VRIRYRIPSPTAAGPELGPNSSGAPVQVILYDGELPTVIEGTTRTAPDGLTVIELPGTEAPAPGTPVQIIIYPPQADPTVIEGTIDDSDDPTVIGVDFTPLRP
jgi:hypothetical protein